MSRSITTTFIIASGTLLEWYDFTLFAYLATLLGNIFFPHTDSVAALLAVFSVYAAGNATRVLGAVWFGQLGDTRGRQRALMYSILLMAIPTILIALTPGYAVIGIAASVLLVLYRLLQGFALGGEYQGNAIYLVERAHKNPGLAGSWVVTMVGLGMLLASGVTTLITIPTMPDYAWRVAFLLGGGVGIAALYVRYRLQETPRFTQAVQQQQVQKLPLKILLKQYPGRFVLAVLIAIGAASYNYSLVFLPTYFTLVHQSSLHDASRVLTISLLVGQFLTPFVGWLSDNLGLKKCTDNKLALMIWGAIGTLLFAYPAYQLYIHGNLLVIVITNLVMGLLCCLYLAPKNALLTQLFPAEICYTGFGLAHNLGLAIAGLVPLWLIKLVAQQQMLMAPAYYFMISSVLALSCLLVLWRYRNQLLNN